MPDAIPLPPIEKIREALNYDPETGCFTRVPRRGHRSGPVDNRPHNGYIRIRIARQHYGAHRLAWALATGNDPVGPVDHINGDKSDNRFCNLRVAEGCENQQNLPRTSSNKTGLAGVHYLKGKRRYAARIQSRGVRHELGTFTCPHEAYAAYLAAKRDLHPSSPVPREPVSEEAAKADRFWLIVHEPGRVPERKGPWKSHQTKVVLREFISARPTAYLHVLTLDANGEPYVEHGPEVLQILDGRSMSVGRKHNARTLSAHQQALAQPLPSTPQEDSSQ